MTTSFPPRRFSRERTAGQLSTPDTGLLLALPWKFCMRLVLLFPYIEPVLLCMYDKESDSVLLLESAGDAIFIDDWAIAK